MGFAEVEARKLTKLAGWRDMYARHPREFEQGFMEKLGEYGLDYDLDEDYGYGRRRRKRRANLLPWILGGGLLGVTLFTPWGNRRLRDIFGSEETAWLANERHPKPFQFSFKNNTPPAEVPANPPAAQQTGAADAGGQ